MDEYLNDMYIYNIVAHRAESAVAVEIRTPAGSRDIHFYISLATSLLGTTVPLHESLLWQGPRDL
jgi:hypothetical protein